MAAAARLHDDDQLCLPRRDVDEQPFVLDVDDVRAGGADRDRGALLDWLAAFGKPPARIFLVHGEEQAAQSLAQSIEARFGHRPERPAHRSAVTL